jgi:hypothetical protein
MDDIRRNDGSSQRLSVKEAIRRHQDPSPFVKSLDDVSAGTKVFIVARVSKSDQRLHRNLDEQKQVMEAACEKRDLLVMGTNRIQVMSGRHKFWMDRMTQAATEARERGATVLVAESTDRLLRSEFFDPSKYPNATPTPDDWERLHAHIGNLEIATLVRPSTRPHGIRSYQRKRGQRFKSKGGRGHKKAISVRRDLELLKRQLEHQPLSYLKGGIYQR